MDLKSANQANLEHVIESIKQQLNIVNAALIRSENYSLDQYDELLDIYHFIEQRKGNLTMMEIEGVLEELRELKS
ncbi:Uncharacterized protein YfkK, UPF0435 family [Seinonella peptonophila]|uniref:Uncharacterized protein YfkK, UPF0435 family n=1 Tax=Seinonella peptonophila TaxID=112248 RepID=A0A1M5AJT9_9BACL|nr:DUF1128 family protein [Seinonella peptonophila]SHF30406.1 Uncharacterized protein YfkK, UPF0435 family [Seinonella peptonophila]